MDAFEAISLPESSSPASRKRFTVEEANRALSLVRRIVSDIVREYALLCDLHRHGQAGQTADEVEDVRQDYARVTDRLAALREELDEIGCELKDYAEGLVDFPARLDGRDVLLCWKLDEEQVCHWHELSAGAAGRRRIENGCLI